MTLESDYYQIWVLKMIPTNCRWRQLGTLTWLSRDCQREMEVSTMVWKVFDNFEVKRETWVTSIKPDNNFQMIMLVRSAWWHWPSWMLWGVTQSNINRTTNWRFESAFIQVRNKFIAFNFALKKRPFYFRSSVCWCSWAEDAPLLSIWGYSQHCFSIGVNWTA